MIKIITVIIIVGTIAVFYFSSRDNSESEINITKQNSNLSFEVQGRISSVSVSVGDTVSKGQILATLENEEKIKKLTLAKADLILQEEILNKLKDSFTSKKLREIEKQKTKVQSTENLFKYAQKDLILILNKAFKSADETIRKNIDQFIDNPKSADPEITFSMSDSDLRNQIEFARFALEVILDDWSDISSNLTVENGLLLVSKETKDSLEQVKSFLEIVSIAVNSLIESDDLSAETIDEYISDVSIAQADVDNALADILAAEEVVKETEILLALEQNILQQQTEKTMYEQILVQEVIVENAETLVEKIQMEINDTYLISPIDGVVVEQIVEVGKNMSPNDVVVVIVPQEDIKVIVVEEEVQTPQTDTIKINPIYFGPIGSDDPITVELPSGKTIELWPGWR